MIENSPPGPPDLARPLVIPRPLRSMSPVNSFLSSMTEDSRAVDFRSSGRGSFQKRTTNQRQQRKVLQ
jgi:hypothetical protein